MSGWRRLLTTDFCPTWNVAALWRQPAAVLAATAATAMLVAVYADRGGLVVGGTLLVLLALGSVWPAVAVAGLRGRVTFGVRRCRQGQATPVTLELVNRLPWPAYGVTVDLGWTRPLAGEPPAADVAVAVAPGWRTTRVTVAVVPPRRGVFPQETVRLCSGFPFGLWHPGRRLDCERPLIVWPQPSPVPTLPEGSGPRTQHSDRLHNRAGTAGETIGVREYRRGDRLQHIHWRQTARHGRPIVRQLQSAAVPLVRVLVDVGEHDPEAFEALLRTAAGVCESAWRRGTDIGLSLGTEAIGGDAVAVRDALAKAAPGGGDLSGLIDGLPSRADAVRLPVATTAAWRAWREVAGRRLPAGTYAVAVGPAAERAGLSAWLHTTGEAGRAVVTPMHHADAGSSRLESATDRRAAVGRAADGADTPAAVGAGA